ncbi:Transketolase domain protein [Ammonifex degensii KC4]|uniref:Transketolase domain protein n=1 Tax=Ammonifex degensii (strain DSM 10501 / KC4) TaxID=429009 RepID=C9R9G5_AMMDK|nr:transketolase [Ammonifex degensii]ACX52944.1 Transketolase domain protein [Ammonifex degensii KC4]
MLLAKLNAPGEYRELERKAQLIRQHVIRMLMHAGSGHPGGSLSAVDILTALYFRVMRIDPENPQDPDRDRFILSKGHAAPALYAVLAERGFFPVSWLESLRRLGSPLQGHPDMRKVPGVEMSTGSLGQGLSVGVGMALAAKLRGSGCRVFVLLGDGECQEGQVWEAAMAAGHYRLNNLVAIVDRNRLQIDGETEKVMALEPLAAKWRAFNWSVIEIDGHNFEEIVPALERVGYAQKPTAIIAHTVKGKGVSFMENQVDWHGVAPKPEQGIQALKELGGR